jgi:hypothetical protein
VGAFFFHRDSYLGEIPHPVVREDDASWEVEGDWKGPVPERLRAAAPIDVEVRPRTVAPIRVERRLGGGRVAEVRGTRVRVRGPA